MVQRVIHTCIQQLVYLRRNNPWMAQCMQNTKKAKVMPCTNNTGTKRLRDSKEMHTRMESQGGVRDYTN